jgi:class 3 adenylate cyclase
LAWRFSLRGSLFAKSFLALFLAVIVPLAVSGLSEAWFSYRAQRERLDQLLGVEARAAATRIQDFLDGIVNHLDWLVQLPWSAEPDERRRIDALRLLRQLPGIVSITVVDEQGLERIHVSRFGLNRMEARTDRRADTPVVGARARKIWFSGVSFMGGSEPHLTVAVTSSRPSAGTVFAEVNLKLIGDVISRIQVGQTGYAFVLDGLGRLIAHPDISLVLRGADHGTIRAFQDIRASVTAAGGQIASVEDARGRAVAVRSAAVPGVDWAVLVAQPRMEAFAPIYGALWRTSGLLLGGIALAAVLAFWLARLTTGPIRLLHEGTKLIGAGKLKHRIAIGTGDELQKLAESFNAMAEGLAESQDRQERIAKLRRFLAPQVAELLDRSGEDDLLEGRREDVVALFVDLRGFTTFSTKASPDEVMRVIAEYHEALGRIVTERHATLVSYMGDGVMILVNAPVPVPNPALHALDLASDMRFVVQELALEWRHLGYDIGFGIGLAFGPATVGRIGYEGRYDYAAIGSVTNLASRLCSAAQDGEILVDATAANAARGQRPLTFLGQRPLKGYLGDVPVFCLDLERKRQAA